MVSFLLADKTFEEYMNAFWLRLQSPSVIVAMVLAAVGLALAILARKFAKITNKSEVVENNDKTLIAFKVVGLTLMFISLIIFIVR